MFFKILQQCFKKFIISISCKKVYYSATGIPIAEDVLGQFLSNLQSSPHNEVCCDGKGQGMNDSSVVADNNNTILFAAGAPMDGATSQVVVQEQFQVKGWLTAV